MFHPAGPERRQELVNPPGSTVAPQTILENKDLISQPAGLAHAVGHGDISITFFE